MGLSFSPADSKYHLVLVHSNHTVSHYTDASLANLQAGTPQFSDALGTPPGEPVWEVLAQMTNSGNTTFTILVRTIFNHVWANTLTFGGAYSGWVQWNNNYAIGP